MLRSPASGQEEPKIPAVYTYQDVIALERIAPELIQQALMDDPIFEYFPIQDLNAAKLRWIIEDVVHGLMTLRGYDGAPVRLLRPGANAYEADPGVFGNFMDVNEQELTERAKGFPADMTIPLDVSDLVRDLQRYLTVAQVQRIRQMAWTLLVTHNLVIQLPQGGVGFQESFAGNTLTVSTLWSNAASSTPLSDLRQAQFIYGRGTSNNFNTGDALMNGKTATYLLNNRNAADLGGLRLQYGETAFNSVDKINEVLKIQGAPIIRVVEDSYQADVPTSPIGGFQGNNYTMYLPDGVVVLVAKRPGNEKPGKFLMTRHMVNGGGMKPYVLIKDQTKESMIADVPPKITVHQGFNGGPVQTRPSQTLTMNVA